MTRTRHCEERSDAAVYLLTEATRQSTNCGYATESFFEVIVKFNI